jgi:hypothetical protein
MRTSVAAAGAAAVLVALSILAVPAVASGADYFAEASASTQSEAASTESSASNTSVTASRDDELVPLITAWGASGAILLGGGALAVAASVRRQRKLQV